MTREEAINKVREMNLPKETKEILEALAPELAESEDERIKSIIIDCLNRAVDVKYISLEDRGKCLAYLEKQGEQKVSVDDFKAKDWYVSKVDGKIHNIYYSVDKVKPRKLVEQKPAWSEEDEKIRKFLVDYFTSYKIGNVATKLNGVRIDDILAYLEKQKEQMSAEWSEEDDWKRKELIQYLEEKGDYRTVWMTWLKSLRPQPKQEWSEEDERMRQTAIEACKTVAEDYENSNERFYKCKYWLETKLKSLHPSWKPSEEQMDSLRDTIINTKGYSYSMNLPELYEQLKKL